MGFIGAWRKWSYDQWETWGKHLNPAAKRIRAWRFTPAQNELLAAAFKALPTKIQQLLMKVLEFLYKYTLQKYGKKAVEDAVEKLIKFLGSFLDIFRKDNS